MTAAEIPCTTPASSDLRERISAAVKRVDVIQLDLDVARLVIHWLGKLAEYETQRNGCPPHGLAEVQSALAESCASGNARQHEDFTPGDAEILGFNRDMEITAAEAAARLGIRADLVRWHCRQGNLAARKAGRQYMVSVSSVENYKRRKADNNRSA
jgi:hypothetical protein